MITTPVPPTYVVAIDAVSAGHADAGGDAGAHASDSAAEDSAHAAESGSTDSTTFSGHDADGLDNYHASYPWWVYVAHPSPQCEIHNQNCPPTNPKQLAAYNAQQHHDAVVGAWAVGGVLLAIVIALFLIFRSTDY